MVGTFKIITLAASLEEKTINLFTDTFHDGGSINVDGARIKCWKAGGHGSETFLEVVENSCNLEDKQEILLNLPIIKVSDKIWKILKELFYARY